MSLKSAFRYGYASARIKAMEADILSGQTMQAIIDADNLDTALTILFQQSSYKDNIARYGGTAIKKNMIDYALSANLAESVNKLVRFAPKMHKATVRALVGRWDIHNMRLAIEAKDRNLPFDKIATSIIETTVGTETIREAMKEGTVEAMIERLMQRSPYSSILKSASAAYAKTHNAGDAIAALDFGYYATLGAAMKAISVEHRQSATMLKMEIDSKNILTLMRGKRAAVQFDQLKGSLILGGLLKEKEMARIYDSSSTVEEVAHKITGFDLKNSIEAYKRTGQMVSFEIGMNNYILNKGLGSLRRSILSFGTMMAYIYLKELEVRTLRIAINSKVYGLSPTEVSGLIVWRKQ